MVKERLLLALFTIILGFNIGIYGAAFGIGFGIFQVFTVLGILAVLPRKKHTPLAWSTAAVAVVSGLLVGFRANSFVQGISFAVSVSAVGLLLLLVSLPEAPTTIWNLISSQMLYVLHSVFGPFRLIRGMSEDSEKRKEQHEWFNPYTLLKTASITLGIFAIFVALLMAADPIFKHMIDTFLKQIVGRIAWSLFLAAVFGGLLTIVLPHKENKPPELRFLSAADVIVPIVVLVGLFGLFLFIQGKYLYASHEVFKQFGLTYSQYVRKGFTELLVATSIASILSYLMILKKRVLDKPAITWLNVVLIVELGLLLGSAYRRDLMYIEVYGLTRMRIIGEVFLFWLGGNLLLLLGLATVKQFEEKFAVAGVGLLTLGALGYFTLVNMDMRIAAAAPQRYEARDLFYLANLSADAAVSWEGIVQAAEQRFAELTTKEVLTDNEKAQFANAKLALWSLVAQREHLEKKFGPWEEIKKTYLDEPKQKSYERTVNLTDEDRTRKRNRVQEWLDGQRKWQAYTLSEGEAYRWLTQNRDLLFDRVDMLLTAITDYQRNRHLDLYNEEWRILYAYEYPFVDLKITYIPPINEFTTPSPTPIPTR